MADISRLLNQATGKAQLIEKRLADIEAEASAAGNVDNPAEDATRLQLMMSWKQSTITQEMFSSIGSQARDLEKRASELACTSFDEEARIKVTHLLIKAKALRDVILQFTK